MEAKFFVSCRFEYEAEDAQNGVDEEKIVCFFDAKIVEWRSDGSDFAGSALGVYQNAVRSKVNCCVCIFAHSRFSLLFHCSVPFIQSVCLLCACSRYTMHVLCIR